MRLLRRQTHHAPVIDAVALERISALPDRAAGDGGVSLDGLEAGVDAGGRRADLELSDRGVIIGASTGDGSGASVEVPSLVLWSAVDGASAEECVELSDGTYGQVLEIAVSDERWPGHVVVRRFVVPAPDVGPLLAAVAAGRGSSRSMLGAAGGVGLGWGAAHAGSAAGLALLTPWRQAVDTVRHAVGRRQVGPIAAALLALVLIAGSAGPVFGPAASGAQGQMHSAHRGGRGNALEASVHPSAHLPVASSAPAPAPPSLASAPPLQSHEIFGYAPYWTLPQSSAFDVMDLTTLAYFSVDANANGTLDQSGAGWNGYQSQDLVDLVTRSHAAGDRVVLTVTCFSQSSLDAISSDPNAGSRLSSALINAISAKNLDGVNFDFEGAGSADRNGLTALITQVSQALHSVNPHWQVSMATYASAAADSAGFYDIAALAPAVDAFFVMAYDMNDRSTPSATSPLVGDGFNDTEALQQFTAVVPAQKVILGVPYYGYDWPTTDGTRTAQSTGSEAPLSDGVIAASGHPTYWDPSTQTAWTSYQVGTQWHETFFDDPTSLALKAQLAGSFNIAGLGIWALGMDGNDPAMLAALLGNAPATKDSLTGPTGGPPGTGFATIGTWNGAAVPLTPVTAPPPGGTQQFLGTLSGLSTTDPALACLQGGPPLNVWSFSTMPGVDVVWAAQPQDCANAIWAFAAPPAPASGAAGGSPATTTTTGPPAPSSPSTTRPPDATTTTAPPTTTTSTTSTTTTPTSTTTTVAPGG